MAAWPLPPKSTPAGVSRPFAGVSLDGVRLCGEVTLSVSTQASAQALDAILAEVVQVIEGILGEEISQGAFPVSPEELAARAGERLRGGRKMGRISISGLRVVKGRNLPQGSRPPTTPAAPSGNQEPPVASPRAEAAPTLVPPAPASATSDRPTPASTSAVFRSPVAPHSLPSAPPTAAAPSAGSLSPSSFVPEAPTRRSPGSVSPARAMKASLAMQIREATAGAFLAALNAVGTCVVDRLDLLRGGESSIQMQRQICAYLLACVYRRLVDIGVAPKRAVGLVERTAKVSLLPLSAPSAEIGEYLARDESADELSLRLSAILALPAVEAERMSGALRGVVATALGDLTAAGVRALDDGLSSSAR